MVHLHNTASVKLVLILIALMAATAANASLLDCTKSSGATLAVGAECILVEPLLEDDQSYAVEQVSPAPHFEVGLTGYQVDQTRSSSALPESVPLLVLIGSFLAVMLVRAKSRNSK